jgi:integral membrane protein (TIGR01906 family)
MKPLELIGKGIARWATALVVASVLIISVVRILMTPLFLEIEYRTPGFPADSYGFTRSERLYWSRYAVDYLVNSAGINYLGDLKFTDGTPLFNENELGHMLDVKNLVQALLKLWLAGIVLLAVLGVWAWQGNWLQEFRRSLSLGGALAIGLVIAILAGVLLNFDTLFISFHEVFFPHGNWQFFYSDTLIRLFPVRFWMDCFIAVGGLTLVGGLALWLIFKKRTHSSK